jgi:hypothetical protein
MLMAPMAMIFTDHSSRISPRGPMRSTAGRRTICGR